ncbi:hypothetical protein [Priestia megaterium]|uniref:hypothetical protein n=1 Tax=Priestia megaterium TaxID=1404 RepID=UPI00040A8895|nr:hypothetical protein [Bacillus sp. S35]
MIGGQGEDSCGKSETDETPQKMKPCTEINCGVISGSAHVSHLFVSRLDSFCYVPASFYHDQ